MNQSGSSVFILIWGITSLQSLEGPTQTNGLYNLGAKQFCTVYIKVINPCCAASETDITDLHVSAIHLVIKIVKFSGHIPFKLLKAAKAS